jgi:hypothetical protein
VSLLLFNDKNETEIVILDEKPMKRWIEIIISLVEKMN